jgi:hypothetical protein
MNQVLGTDKQMSRFVRGSSDDYERYERGASQARYRAEPERGASQARYRAEPERSSRAEPERSSRAEPERSSRAEPERGASQARYRADPERSSRADPERSSRAEPERGASQARYRADPERSSRAEPERPASARASSRAVEELSRALARQRLQEDERRGSSPARSSRPASAPSVRGGKTASVAAMRSGTTSEVARQRLADSVEIKKLSRNMLQKVMSDANLKNPEVLLLSPKTSGGFSVERQQLSASKSISQQLAQLLGGRVKIHAVSLEKPVYAYVCTLSQRKQEGPSNRFSTPELGEVFGGLALLAVTYEPHPEITDTLVQCNKFRTLKCLSLTREDLKEIMSGAWSNTLAINNQLQVKLIGGSIPDESESSSEFSDEESESDSDSESEDLESLEEESETEFD